jgi:outer membrane protein TolC
VPPTLSDLSPLRPALTLAAGLLGACASPPQRPNPPVFDPAAAYSMAWPDAPAVRATAAVWWREAVADDLWSPLEQALEANATLQGAVAEVQAAQARLAQAQADAGPEASLNAGAGVQKASGDEVEDSRSAGVDAGLPLDLSGALAQRIAAARFNLAALRADAAQLRSDLARDYLLAALDGAEAEQRIALLGRQLEVAGTLLRLIELRFTQGLASSVDVLQQRDQLAALRQQLPLARLDRKTAFNRVRQIANLTPQRALPLTLDALPEVQAGFGPVEPQALLERRALLRARRARLAAADARFAAALADRLPTLRLSGSALTRVAAGDLGNLVAATLDAAFTLFDSGNKLAIAAERRAELAAAGEQYLADWIGSVIAVDNLLHEEASLRERIVLSQQRLETAEALLRAAQRRYARGVSDYLPALEALRGLQQQQRDLLALQAELARSRVRLYHALGQPEAEASA